MMVMYIIRKGVFMEKTGFLEESPGIKSSVRLNITILLCNGVLLMDVVVISGVIEFIRSRGTTVTLVGVVTAASVLFGSIIFPCITWKQMSKKGEKQSG